MILRGSAVTRLEESACSLSASKVVGVELFGGVPLFVRVALFRGVALPSRVALFSGVALLLRVSLFIGFPWFRRVALFSGLALFDFCLGWDCACVLEAQASIVPGSTAK